MQREKRSSSTRCESTVVDPQVATQQHCSFAFDVLIAHLAGVQAPAPDFEDAHCPLFVTWNKNASWDGEQGQLRGCIGTLQPRRLHTALKDYALTSALCDSRFSPVQLKEVPQLSCGVSLLSRFEDAGGWRDWEVGTHGLTIEFVDPSLGCKRTATFLPEVAEDQGWTQRQCIEALVRKAGYHGRASEELLDSLRVTRYQSTKACLEFPDYVGSSCSRLDGVERLLQRGAATSAAGRLKLMLAN